MPGGRLHEQESHELPFERGRRGDVGVRRPNARDARQARKQGGIDRRVSRERRELDAADEGHKTRLSGHDATLSGHGASLVNHGNALIGHGNTLDSHGANLVNHANVLSGHGTALTSHAATLSGHDARIGAAQSAADAANTRATSAINLANSKVDLDADQRILGAKVFTNHRIETGQGTFRIVPHLDGSVTCVQV